MKTTVEPRPPVAAKHPDVQPRFTVGGRVRHKGGGQVMTVTSVSDSVLACTWTDDDGSEWHNRFELNQVELVGF